MREDVEVVGFDSSEEAIRFAAASHMIDEGIALNLEEEKSALTAGEAHLSAPMVMAVAFLASASQRHLYESLVRIIQVPAVHG